MTLKERCVEMDFQSNPSDYCKGCPIGCRLTENGDGTVHAEATIFCYSPTIHVVAKRQCRIINILNICEKE